MKFFIIYLFIVIFHMLNTVLPNLLGRSADRKFLAVAAHMSDNNFTKNRILEITF